MTLTMHDIESIEFSLNPDGIRINDNKTMLVKIDKLRQTCVASEEYSTFKVELI
jgi:hypothetical protein